MNGVVQLLKELSHPQYEIAKSYVEKSATVKEMSTLIRSLSTLASRYGRNAVTVAWNKVDAYPPQVVYQKIMGVADSLP